MTPDRRATFLVDLRLAIQRRGKTVGMVADEARVPPIVLRQFLDGRMDLPQMPLLRLETWYNQLEKAPRRPVRMEDFPSPLLKPALPLEPEASATRRLNMASLARDHEAMRREVGSLRGRVEHLEGQFAKALEADR